MSLPAAVQWALLGAVVVVGILLERRMAGTEPLISTPNWLTAALGGLALGGPWLLLFEGALTTPIVDETIVALALSAALWLTATKVVGVGGSANRPC